MGKFNKQMIPVLIAASIAVFSGLYVVRDLYKEASFKVRRPEIMKQVNQIENEVRAVMAVKQDAYWSYPKRVTYQGDRETLYIKTEDGRWTEFKTVWMTEKGGRYMQLKTLETRTVSEDQIPGKPKNALKVLVDFDKDEEYAEAKFEIKESYEATQKDIEDWVSNIKPMLLKNYNKINKEG